MDCPYQYYITSRTHDDDADVDNPAKFRSLQGWCRDRGVAFHLVVNAEPRSGPSEFYTGTLAYVNRLLQDQIFPDVITVQSWYPVPVDLRESSAHTFMKTARDAFATYCGHVSGVQEPAGQRPETTRGGSWPNPAHSRARIAYRLAAAEQVTLEIFDVSGRRIRIIPATARNAGRHEIIWDGRDERGLAVGAGVYFYRLRSESLKQRGRITLIR